MLEVAPTSQRGRVATRSGQNVVEAEKNLRLRILEWKPSVIADLATVWHGST